MKKVIVLFFVIFSMSFAQTAQKENYVEKIPTVSLGLGFQMAFPTGEHKDNNDNIGFGFNIDGAYQFNNTPILVGGNFAYTIFGSDTRNVPWSLTIPDVRVDVTTTNSYLYGTLFFRIQPDLKYVMPYFEGHFGFNYLETRTEVEDMNHNDDDDYSIASSVDLSDGGFLYGFGGGVEIPLYKNKVNKEDYMAGRDIPFQITLDLQARYLFGQELEYLNEESKQIVDGEVIYDKIKSKTDILGIKIGVGFKF